jgi:hypothetical protein
LSQHSSGTDGRIVSYAVPLFISQSGEEALTDMSAEILGPISEGPHRQLERFAEIADEAAKTVAVT